MAEGSLHAQRKFFNEISHEIKRIKLMIQYIQTYIDQARVRGYRIGDNELLAILDHVEEFFSVIQESSNRLEKNCNQL